MSKIKNPYETIWDYKLGRHIMRKDQEAAHEKVRQEDEERWKRYKKIAAEMEEVNPSYRDGFTTGY